MPKSQAVEQAVRRRGIGHDRDHRATPTAPTVQKVVREHPPEEVSPWHPARSPHRGHRGSRRTVRRIWTPTIRVVRRWHQATELLALSRGRREQPVVPNQMPPRRGNDPA
jgi:hypothetical protein